MQENFTSLTISGAFHAGLPVKSGVLVRISDTINFTSQIVDLNFIFVLATDNRHRAGAAKISAPDSGEVLGDRLTAQKKQKGKKTIFYRHNTL